ncbi:hypothetical protein HQN59_01315 [Schlegelella sp. ID0723]|uniref:DUF2971 domain-containing protein n=1 Tax=Piscinibacter koreensis TaxID=2742824 RepID=A0A7Y6NJT1_9BURK|nr:hypothetical protein [Schlegelella koreensis]
MFHYTDGAGLIGITKQRKMRCTHIAYLNDSKEWLYSGELIYKALQSIKDDSSSRSRTKEYVDVAFQQINSDGYGKTFATDSIMDANQEFPKVYVASFTRHHDDLNMWRGYSARNARYAIGFRTAALRAAPRGDWYFEAAVYDEEALLSAMRQSILEKFELLDRGLTYPGTNDLRPPSHSEAGGLRHFINDMRRWIGPFVKHPKFKAEGEWRLWRFGEASEFRASESFITPYLEIDIDPDAFSSVVLGPTSHPLLSERSLKQLLSSNGLSEVVVIRSDVPYRS